MKRIFGAALAVAMMAAPALADDRAAEVTAKMHEYLTLWNAHDAQGVITNVYRMDASPVGDVAGLQRNFDQLKSQGYDHSEEISLETCLLTDTTALAEFRFTRFKTDGTPLGPRQRATLYMLRKFDDGWRITQLLGMDYGANLNCTSAPK